MKKFKLLYLSLGLLCACGSADNGYAPEASDNVSQALGGITFVQVNSSDPQSSPTSVAVKYTKAQIAGDTNIVPICWFNATSNVTSVADTKLNTYAVAAPIVRLTGGNGPASCVMYYAANIKAAAANGNTVTVHFSAASLDPDVRISEYSGLSSSPLDVSASATGTTSLASSGNATTTVVGDLLVGSDYLSSSTNGSGTGFTSRVITSPDSDILEDMVAGSPGSYAATAPTSGGWWLMQMAAFKPAGSSDAGVVDAGSDAGFDTGAEASIDASVDAQTDAATESGTVDAGSEASDDASEDSSTEDVTVSDAGTGGDATVDSGMPDSGTLPDSGTVTATLVQHVSGSNLRANSMSSPFCYTLYLPAPSTAGNAIVVGATWKGNSTLSVTDDKGDVYTDNKVFTDITDNQSVGIASSFGVAAGARTLNICFSSKPGGWVQPMASEFAGIIGIDGAGVAASGTGASAGAGILTPTTSDLVYQVVYTPNASPSSFAATGSKSLLSADIEDGFAAQYGVAGTGSNSIAMGSSVRWVTAAMLLQTGNAGSVPSGMRIVHLDHINLPVSSGAGGSGYYPTPTPLQFPSSGNLLIAVTGGGCGCTEPASVSSITDGTNTWALASSAISAGDAVAQILYAGNATTSSALQISIVWNQPQTDDETAMLYDVTGASSSPFDVGPHGSGSAGGGNLTLPFTVIPAQAGELIVLGTPWDFDTAANLLGSPEPAVDFLVDTNLTSGESHDGPFPIDENNGWGHAWSTGTAPMSFTWVPEFDGEEFGTYAAVSAAFKPAP